LLCLPLRDLWLIDHPSMSFNCQMCGQHYGYAPYRRVVQVRPVKYETQIVNGQGHQIGNVNSDGFEVSRELMVCSSCMVAESKIPQRQSATKVVRSTSKKQKRKVEKLTRSRS